MFTFRGSDISLFILELFSVLLITVYLLPSPTQIRINVSSLVPLRIESILFYSLFALWGITFCNVVSSL